VRPDIETCRDPDLLAAEVRRLRAVIAAGELALTDAEREAVAWAIAVTCAMPHNAIGPIQRERLRDLIARHGRDT